MGGNNSAEVGCYNSAGLWAVDKVEMSCCIAIASIDVLGRLGDGLV